MDTNVVAYKCPSCGAPLSFSVETQDFACEYCGGHYHTKEQIDYMLSANKNKSFQEIDYIDSGEPTQETEYIDDSEFNENNSLYVCPSCGAAVMTDSQLSASAICHYCHSPVVLSGRLSGEFRPHKIIPFKKTKEQALEGFDLWIKGKKFFMAKGFGAPEALEKIQGIYVPYWLADCSVEGNLNVDVFKTLSTTRSGDYIVKREERISCVRDGSIIFHGIPADGSSKANDMLMESIEPFNYDELLDFNMSYLSGHNAEKYDVTKEMVYPRIMQRAAEGAEAEFLKTIQVKGRTEIVSKNFRITNINWKYAMLPLWFMSYNYKGKMYYYAMNGQTGKFGGIIPYNKLKVLLFSVGIPLALGIGAFILFILGGSL